MASRARIIADMDMKSHSLTVTPQPRLRRRFFGLRTRDVWAALDQREKEAAELRQRAGSAGTEMDLLREHVSWLEAKLAEVEHDAGTRAGKGAKRPFCDCPPSEDLLEEMTKVVSVTEEATNRILGHARDTLMKEIEAAEALRDRAREEIQEAAAWRRHWAPILHAFQATVAETNMAVEEVPERMRHALAPLAAAAAALDEDLKQFAAFEVTMSLDQFPIVVEEAEDGASGADIEEPVVIADEAEPAPAAT